LRKDARSKKKRDRTGAAHRERRPPEKRKRGLTEGEGPTGTAFKKRIGGLGTEDGGGGGGGKLMEKKKGGHLQVIAIW